ncbi:Proline-rich receptor-like protein kinase PERK15, partial [Bienertia sinuspersici]
MISHVHHKPLVSLAGYCITGSQNKTMEFHLHGEFIVFLFSGLFSAKDSLPWKAYKNENCSRSCKRIGIFTQG